MAGIYIHIPYCKQACHYCNFHFSTSLKHKNELLAAMQLEIGQRKTYLNGATIGTIYFGGGTPSLLSRKELEALLESLDKLHNVSADAEITLEANPDDITREKLQVFKAVGINRLSIGIQSFRDADLQYMNRSHNAGQAKASVKLAQDIGFDNITIDLIYGTPGMNNEAWQANLQQALELNVPHISAYCLTVEPKTALASFVKSGKSPDVDEHFASQQFDILQNTLVAAGFEHYEISNFAKPGYRSRHNSSYWKGVPYLGIGPGAHSYDGTNRQWNIANNPLYTKALQDDKTYFEVEELTETDRFNEALMIGLRLTEGLDLSALQKFPADWITSLRQDMQHYLESGQLVQQGDQLSISKEARFISDQIISDLFRV